MALPIRIKLPLLVLCSVLLVAAAGSGLWFLLVRRHVLEQARAREQETLSRLAASFHDELEFLAQTPRVLAADLSAHPLDQQEIERLLERYVAMDRRIYGMCVAFDAREPAPGVDDLTYICRREGRIRKIAPDPKYGHREQEWFDVPRRRNGEWWTAPYVDRGLGLEPMITFSAPVRDEAGSFMGVATYDYVIDALSHRVEQIRIGETGYAMLLDRNGNIVAHPDHNLTLAVVGGREQRQTLAAGLPPGAGQAVWDALRAGPTGSLIVSSEGRELLVMHAAVGQSGMRLLAAVPVVEIQAPAAAMLYRALVVSAITAIVLVGLAFVVSVRVTRPIVDLVTLVERIARGDAAPLPPTSARKGELGMLEDTLIRMAAQVREAATGLENRIASRTAELESANAQLAERTHALDIQTFELVRESDKLSREVEERRKAEGELSQTIRELSQSRDRLKEQTAELAAMAKGLSVARDEALASARAKSEFLANMSHEIRTPLNGVIGMAELLAESDLSSDQRELSESIQRSGEALLALVNDILDFGRIEAGKLSIEPADFDLRTLVEDAGEQLEVTAEEKGIDVLLDYPAAAPRRFVGDAGRVRQVLANLAGNALKFTREGHVLIKVEVELRSPGQARVRIEVEDTGIGIPEGKCASIFESFTQAEEGAARRYGGAGLGLAISKQLVGLMGGAIGVRSQVGKGSIFWFALPLPLAPGPETAEHPGPSSQRVLVVEASAIGRRLLTEQVRSWGLRVTEAASWEEAKGEIERGAEAGDAYAVVIASEDLKGGSARDLLRFCRDREDLAATSLVLVAAALRRQEAQRLLEEGFAGCLLRPVRQSQLMDVLTSIWSAKGEARAASEPSGAPLPLPHEGLRVLLVEDHPVSQGLASRMLASLGCVVDACGNGVEALARIAQGEPYAVIFMDCHMPEMDGLEATREIRRREGAERRAAIVAMTADAMPHDRKRCLAAGMDDYVAKPIRRSDLERCLSRWGRGRAARGAPDGRPRALLVEDNPTNQRLAARVLASLGCRVDIAGTGREALDLFERSEYAIVFMDCRMPEIDGYETTREIRRREGQGPRVPIVALTASAMEGDRERCLRAGMDDYLAKPVRREEIEASLRRWVARS